MVKAGTYGPEERPAPGVRVRIGPRRQLWWCYPNGKGDKTGRHRFAEMMPRQMLQAQVQVHTCLECATELELFEGPPMVRSHEFAARVIAAALVSTGQGVSYHQAARAARAKASWARRTKPKNPPGTPAGTPLPPLGRPGANGTLAGDWVGLFAPMVTEPVLGPESWPAVVCLDEKPFAPTMSRRRAYLAAQLDVAEKAKAARLGLATATLDRKEREALDNRIKQELGWVVYGAWAPHVGQTGTLFRLGAARRLDATEAAKFLLTTPGRPQVVVCDGTGVWPKAVALAWPPVVDANGVVLEATPQVSGCEWHLQQRMRAHLRSSGILPPRESQRMHAKAPKTYHGASPWPPQPAPVRAPSAPGPGAAWTATPPQRKVTGMRRLRVAAIAAGREDELRFALLTEEDAERHPLTGAVRHALDNPERWDELVALADTWQATQLSRWLVKNAALRQQIVARNPRVPRSIGGLEAALQSVGRLIGDRSHLLTNTVRTQRLLDLVTLHLRGVADERTYAERISQAVQPTAGSAPAQRPGVRNAARLHA